MANTKISRLLPKLPGRQATDDQRRAEAYQRLLRLEAKLGGELFGPVPAGRSREFFCLDERTWVWHESWIDAYGNTQMINTHYTVRPDAVLKSQNNQGYQKVSADEFKTLRQAIKLYVQRVPAELQRYQFSTI
ncbi:MAG: hypothetical protein JWO41_387 [Candidatus Saccharibacteria bacterium]|nr:hypothetical protein [Candidatus Saccharibacteria bacterium]